MVLDEVVCVVWLKDDVVASKDEHQMVVKIAVTGLLALSEMIGRLPVPRNWQLVVYHVP